MASDDRDSEARRRDSPVPMSTPTPAPSSAVTPASAPSSERAPFSTPMPWTGAGGWNGADGRTGSIEAVRAAEADAHAAALARESSGDGMPLGAASAGTTTAGRTAGRVRWLLGAFSLAFAALTVVLLITGLTLGFGKDYAASTSVAFAAIASSIVGFIMGGAAVITHRGRALGVVAVVLSVLANPVALTQILGWFGAVG